MRARRVSFVAPFVIVVAGCGGKPAPTTGPTTTPPETSPTSKPETAQLPDPPTGDSTRTQGDAGVTIIEYASGDRVYMNPDGTCHAEYQEHCANEDDEGKPVVSNCNPPPPQQVKCPK